MASSRRTQIPHDARSGNLAIIVSFLLIISLPLASNIIGIDGADPQSENRGLATMPRLDGTFASIADYGNNFGRWFEDHFAFRATLVRWYGETRYFWLGVSPSPTVIKGRDGWLFYADDGSLEDCVNETLLSASELEAWRETLTRTHSWLRARGVAYVFTIPPDKHAIYPEKLPSSLRCMNTTSRTDQVEAMLADRTSVPVVDVRPALLSAKARDRVYFQTDTHWNDRGALVAYQRIIEAVRRQVPSVPPAWTRGDFEPTERVIEGLDLARMIGLTRILHETDYGLRPGRPHQARVIEPAGGAWNAEVGRFVTEIPGSGLPRALIFRDSFTSRLAPLLSEHFSRAVYLWQNDFDADAVGQERPDVVIQEIAGRHLYVFTPSPELIPQ